MKTLTYSFGYWLRRRRKALDLTQRALALAVSCSEDAIRKIEADERRPSRRLADRIAERLAIPAEERTAFLDAARAVHSSGALEVDDDPHNKGVRSHTATVAADRSAPQATRAAPPGRSPGNLFIGRSNELVELQHLFDEACTGGVRMAMLAGEPGIGKTRTAQELADDAGERKALVLWGRCYENEGAPSYWPWVHALRAYVRDRSSEQLRAEIGFGASSIAEIVEEVRERLPEVKPAPTLEPESARVRLFDAIATLLQDLGRRRVLLLIMDDLHWADAASLRLLEYVAAEVAHTPLLILGAYRDTEITRKHALSRTLAEITRHVTVHRTTLRGLGHDEVGRFIAALWTEGGVPAGLIDVVYRQTEGNPLFVTEVMRLLIQEGR